MDKLQKSVNNVQLTSTFTYLIKQEILFLAQALKKIACARKMIASKSIKCALYIKCIFNSMADGFFC